MICQHCGAALPPIAMFCGECGRSVAARSPIVPPVPLTSTAMPFSASEPLSITPASPPAPDEPPLASPGAPSAVADAPLTPPAPPLSPPPVVPVRPVVPLAPTPVTPPSPPSTASAGDSAPHDGAAHCARCGAAAEPGDVFCGTCGERLPSPAPLPSVSAAPTPTPVAERPAPTPASPPQPWVSPPSPASAVAPVAPVAPPVPHAVESTLDPDTENTRLVPRGTTGARFVLQFSTGESYTVLGSGIIGRNPTPEPGEAIDHIVTIVDPGRSVSKSHLEFGQDNGVFWVSDRHSGNGSVIREPGSEPRYCVPGRRYRVVRGTRIDIGEQFVVVS